MPSRPNGTVPSAPLPSRSSMRKVSTFWAMPSLRSSRFPVSNSTAYVIGTQNLIAARDAGTVKFPVFPDSQDLVHPYLSNVPKLRDHHIPGRLAPLFPRGLQGR